ncbi:hypothetical protein PVAND_014932 [Polypedilum vanderplanki]|uniref:Uncharacterized protein n=1 Tax=Polypedilum vanderplanki TaxID=319348 RepID=A0A9J6BB67_POLVA|nr:hypothetical protein PVAND_014932 [Polypedilum vanderplanki]
MRLLTIICLIVIYQTLSIFADNLKNDEKALSCEFNEKPSKVCFIQVKSIITRDFKIQPPINSTSIKIHDLNKNFNVHFMPQNISSTFPELQQMIFDHLALTKVTKSDLIALTKLQFLYLDSNLITKIDSDAFDDLQSLTLLDLDYNRLTSLHPDLFKKLKKLETLSIHDNYLTTLDEKIFSENSKLKSIKLHNNEINELSSHMLNNLKPTDVSLRKNFCIDKEYRGEGIITTYAVDVEKSCKVGRLKILQFFENYSILIIGICFAIILSLIVFLVVKKILKIRRNKRNTPMNYHYARKKPLPTIPEENVYDELDVSRF